MSSVMEGVDRLTRIAGQNRVELLLFQLGPAQTFGINVFKVREVLKCRSYAACRSPIPTSAASCIAVVRP